MSLSIYNRDHQTFFTKGQIAMAMTENWQSRAGNIGLLLSDFPNFSLQFEGEEQKKGLRSNLLRNCLIFLIFVPRAKGISLYLCRGPDKTTRRAGFRPRAVVWWPLV